MTHLVPSLSQILPESVELTLAAAFILLYIMYSLASAVGSLSSVPSLSVACLRTSCSVWSQIKRCAFSLFVSAFSIVSNDAFPAAQTYIYTRVCQNQGSSKDHSSQALVAVSSKRRDTALNSPLVHTFPQALYPLDDVHVYHW
jgi:hypothetical protein